MPASSPFWPSATSSTSGGPGSEVKMTSHCSAKAFGESAQLAPAAMCRSAAARLMSCTTSSYPAFCRLAAMLAPIVPSPIKPTFMYISLAIPLLPRGRGWRSSSLLRRMPGAEIRPFLDDFAAGQDANSELGAARGLQDLAPSAAPGAEHRGRVGEPPGRKRDCRYGGQDEQDKRRVSH